MHNEKSNVKNAYTVCCGHLLASLIDCQRVYIYSVCVCVCCPMWMGA